MSALPRSVRVVEVGPRDGLQNQTKAVPAATKLEWIERLARAGVREIEATSFVRPDRIPQLADAAEVAAALPRVPGTLYSALVPNRKGLEGALAAGIDRIALFTAASETFCRKNIAAGIDESIERFRELLAAARAAGAELRVRAYISTCFGCPYEGEVPPRKVVEVAAALRDLGVDEIAVSDTIGVATPADVHRVLDALGGTVPPGEIALHFHDTRGTALANVYAALGRGQAVFDASAGGLGGCPYAPGASGNLATEDLVYLLRGLGIECGIDLDRLVESSLWFEGVLGVPLPSRVLAAERAARAAPPAE